MHPTHKTQITLLRHGECQGGHIFRGTYDVALTERGFRQMQSSVDFARTQTHWDAICSSPLKRCRVFSETLSEKLSLPLQIHQEISEYRYGDWEGKPVEAIEKLDGHTLQQWRNKPDSVTPPNGEAINDFKNRVSRAFNTIVAEHRGKSILLVVHGGVIRIILNSILEMPLEKFQSFDVPFACLSQLEVTHQSEGIDRIRIHRHNYGPDSAQV